MRIINILEIVNGIPYINKSFGIYEEQLSEEVVQEAEDLFKKLIEANPNDISDEEIEEAIENGYWETDYSVHIIWSEIN